MNAMIPVQVILFLLVSIHDGFTSDLDYLNEAHNENIPWQLEDLRSFEKHENEVNALIERGDEDNMIERGFGTPTNVYRCRLININGFSLAMDKSGKVYGETEKTENGKFKCLIYDEVTVRLESEEFQNYIAISCETGKVYGTKQLSRESLLIFDTKTYSPWETFRSSECPRISGMSDGWYLGIKRNGKYRNAMDTSAKDKSVKFQIMRTN